MIKAVIFDAGGVVCSTFYLDICKKYSKRFGISEEDIGKAIRASDEDAMLGRDTVEVLAKKISAHIGHQIPAKEFRSILEKSDANPKVLALAKGLRKRYRIVLLSDNLEPNTSAVKKNVGHAFDKMYFSNELHMKKPWPKTFRFVCKDLGLKPQECVFIDDREYNVKAAKKVGMEAILYINYKQLIVDLKEAGVSI